MSNDPAKRAAEDIQKIREKEEERKVDKGIIKDMEIVLKHGQDKNGANAFKSHSRKYQICKVLGHYLHEKDAETGLCGELHALARAYLLYKKKKEEEKQ